MALQRAEKRSKRQGRQEKRTQPNAEFQRINRRDKKGFLSEQCTEIEENNRMGETRDLFKEIRVTKGTFHAKMSSIKDRHGKDLQKQKRLRRGGKNTQKNYTKKGLNDTDNHDDVVTHLEVSFPECEVKCALGSITISKLVEVTEFQPSSLKSR